MMSEKILIVDDEIDMLMLLKMVIEDNTEFKVETTNNPSEALKLFSHENFDLVITDFKMPGMDGMELFDELKGIKDDIPVIIITAYGSLDASDLAFQKGIADFITKPFRKDNILFTIKRVLELYRMRKENIELKKKLEHES